MKTPALQPSVRTTGKPRETWVTADEGHCLGSLGAIVWQDHPCFQLFPVTPHDTVITDAGRG